MTSDTARAGATHNHERRKRHTTDDYARQATQRSTTHLEQVRPGERKPSGSNPTHVHTRAHANRVREYEQLHPEPCLFIQRAFSSQPFLSLLKGGTNGLHGWLSLTASNVPKRRSHVTKMKPKFFVGL